MNINKALYYYKRNSWMLWWPFMPFLRLKTPQSPIFLLGNQGDGITFISRILRRNTRLVSVSGGARYWTGADEMATVMESYLPKEIRLAGRITKTDPPHDFFSQPRSWSYGSDDLFHKYHMTEEHATKRIGRRLNRALGLAAYRFGGQGVRFIDKSQVYTLKTRLIQKSLNNADPYFVLFVRDPYVSCYRAAMGKAGDMKRYSADLSFDERLGYCIEHWKNCMNTALEDSKHLKRFKWYRFEDFIKNTEDQTIDLCRFLNLTYSPNMLPAEGQSIPRGTKYTMRWYPVKSDVNTKYLNQIAPEYFDRIEAGLGELAAYFGYVNPNRNNKLTT